MVLQGEADDLGLFHDVALVVTRVAALGPPGVLDVSSADPSSPHQVVNTTAS